MFCTKHYEEKKNKRLIKFLQNTSLVKDVYPKYSESS